MPVFPVFFRRAFVASAVLWSASLFVATYAASRPRGMSAMYAFALGVYSVGSVICHQRADRSFHVWAAQLPVCARCTGIYLGAAVAALAIHRPAMPNKPQPVLLVALLPTMVTLVFEWSTGITPSNWVRALAGFPLGLGVTAILIGSLSQKL